MLSKKQFLKTTEALTGIKATSARSDYEKIVDRRVAEEFLRRKTEATAIYEPLPETMAFHRSNARERILRGSNRSSKTMSASLEVGWAVTNRHPFLKYPKTGRAICVGANEDHIGHTMWDKLSNPITKWRMIQDLETGKWRTYRWWTDKARFHETKPVSPIIPPRMIENIAFRAAGKNVPAVVYLKNGWEMWWFTGGSAPPRGLDADIAWVDEELNSSQFYNELVARLVDRRGRFIWSATPQTGGAEMWNLHLRAEDYKDREVKNPPVEEFFVTIDGNKYIEPEEKAALKEQYKNDPEAYRVRILGEYLITSFRVYPTFARAQHVVEPLTIPDDWARYLVIDPGHAVCAVLFFAVPPDQSHVYCYDELYIRDCNVSMLAEKVRHKVQGHNFQAFIIDFHGSIRTEATGLTILETHSEAFRKARIRSNATGNGFMFPKAGDIETGCQKVREWLSPAADGKPYLLIFPNCEHFIHEMERYHKKREGGIIVDKPEQKGFHAVDAARYAAMNGLKYHKPRPTKQRTAAQEYLDKKRQRHRESDAIYLA
jgi:hypothetical protein